MTPTENTTTPLDKVCKNCGVGLFGTDGIGREYCMNCIGSGRIEPPPRRTTTAGAKTCKFCNGSFFNLHPRDKDYCGECEVSEVRSMIGIRKIFIPLYRESKTVNSKASNQYIMKMYMFGIKIYQASFSEQR